MVKKCEKYANMAWLWRHTSKKWCHDILILIFGSMFDFATLRGAKKYAIFRAYERY